MKKLFDRIYNVLLATALCGLLPAQATVLDISTPRPLIPPNVITSSNRPMIMLAASKDHSLFGPIYTDFEDLDGDGVIDTTFIPTFKYYGYFDPTKCYDYKNSQFEPVALANAIASTKITTIGTVTTTTDTVRYTCSVKSSYWSGNFLNWSSMTRLDIVRKMLYGGTRSTDTVSNTVLELAKLNFDAHSFVKFYAGLDVRDYTPFTTAALTKTTGSNPNVYAGLSICMTGSSDNSTASPNPPVMRMVKGNVRFWATVELVVCRWKDNDNYSLGTFGPKLERYYKNNSTNIPAITPYAIAHELTIPSVANDGATYSTSGIIGPELIMRVKVCDASLLGEEHCQAFPPSSTTNFKPYGLFQEFGFSITGDAARAEFGVITGSYDKNYTAGALRKNMGDFSGEININTGVFCHSPSAACALAVNGAIKSFDKILLNDRGGSQRYLNSGVPSGVAEGSLSSWGNPMGGMLVQALQYYAYNGSTPTPTNPSPTTKDTALGLPVVDWQDPLSNSNATRKSLYGNAICRPLNTLLLSSSTLSFDGQAASPFSTLPNTIGTINDYTNRVGNTEGINGTLRSVGSVSGGYGDSCSAKTVGLLSDVSGICPEAPGMGGTYQVAGAAFYGNTSKIRTIASPPSDLKNVKDALKVKTLAASLTGGSPRIDIPVPGTGTSASNPLKYIYITPESVQTGGIVSAPLTFASISSSSTHGAFVVTWNDILMGGDYDMDITGYLRYDINSSTNEITVTTDIPGICGGSAGTHGFSIIGVKTAGNLSANGRYLTHQNFSGVLPGMPNTSEYLCGDSTYRNLASPINSNSSLVTTYNNIKLTSPSFSGAYGDTVCNVAGNGETGDPAITNLPFYCTVKNIDYPVSLTFKMAGETNALVKDPLFYAAKYGNFDSSIKKTDGSNTYAEVALPLTLESWDKFSADGTMVSDGIPDGYFLARRPDLLEAQLRKALDSLAKNANSAPATTSGQLSNGNYKYVAMFDSTTVTGNINAYQVQSNGLFLDNPTWQVGQKLQIRASTDSTLPLRPGNSRQIITNFGNKSVANTTAGIRFRWADLPAGYQTQMTSASTNKLSTTSAELALNYIRGDQILESASIGLRERGNNLLGPIVNAAPWVQSAPAANYQESQFTGYGAFVTSQQDRNQLLWVSANDGMLHAFCADVGKATGSICTEAGREIFAYIPGVLANRLAEIPLQRGTTGRTRLNGNNFTLDSTETHPASTVWAYVDGSPFSADIKTNIVPATISTAETGTWKTYVFSSLGRGGRAVFALDATTLGTLAAAEAGSTPNSVFQWQFTSDDDSDLGYLINDISLNSNSGQANPVVRLNNGKFALLLGNGYKSSNGKAVLFLLYVDGPTLASGWSGQYVKIVADAGSGNGLMVPTWIDRNNDGTADVVYAGDLKGNMWKFDISSALVSNWDVAYKGLGGVNRPLFKAENSTTTRRVATVTPLPITTAPEYVYPAFDGLIINFGTGISLETGDFPNTSVPQRFYGLWDRPSFATTAATGTGPMIVADMSTLVQRNYTRDPTSLIVTATPTNTTVNGVTTSSYPSIDWTANDGWYFDFPNAPTTASASIPNLSEMLLSNPDVQAGFLIFPTVRSKVAGDTCSSTPDVTLYVIDPIAGVPTRKAQGLSGTTLIAGTPTQDQKWVTVSNRTAAPWNTTTCTATETGCTNIVNGIGEKPGACAPGNKVASPQGAQENRTLCYNPLGRVQWREIPGLRTDQ